MPTETLRAMLDERGVEWDTFSVSNTEYTHWTNSDGHWCAASIGGPLSLHVNILNATPEQAIAATLGPGTCHVKAAKKIGDLFGFSLSCWHSMVNPFDDHPDYCPWCGAKVVDE